MKKTMSGLCLLLALCLFLSCTAAFAEEKAEPENCFDWHGFRMYFPGATTNLEAYGIKDFQGVVAAVRLAPGEGTIRENEFKQQLFVLVDPEGNEHACKFYTCPNNEKNAIGIRVMDAEQEYVDMLFELGTLTEENILLCSVAVYESAEAEPVLIPLSEATETIAVPAKD